MEGRDSEFLEVMRGEERESLGRDVCGGVKAGRREGEGGEVKVEKEETLVNLQARGGVETLKETGKRKEARSVL